MSSTLGSRSQESVRAALHDAAPIAEVETPRWYGGDVSLPISTARLNTLLPGAPGLRAGNVGVVMCLLPLDISLRAYAIDAIVGVADERGLQVLGRRDVPVRAGMLGDNVFTRPHVAQFFILRPDEHDLDTFERELSLLQAAVECEMSVLGMTSEDVRVVSCSARTLVYTGIAGQGDVMAIYPDLENVPRAGVKNRPKQAIHRRQNFA